ncbi:MAG: hypothetical protein ABIQ93_05390 [Saprospiraceae bacterium]
MRALFFLLTLGLQAELPAQVLSIAQARAMPAGSNVTVHGMVINGPELGRMRYLQDDTAGIVLFPGNGSLAGFERSTNSGDSIEVSGTLLVYYGMLEISPITAYRIIQRKRALPAPKPIGIAEIGLAYESQRVLIDSLYFTDSRDTFSSNSSFEVSDNKGHQSKVFMPKNSPLSGAFLPDQPIQLLAIVSRYKEYQLLPLNLPDYLAKELQKPVLDADTVTTVLSIKNCASGKITVKDTAGKEWLFSLAHSSGTTQLELTGLPSGSYLALVRTHGQVFSLPFQNV